jgi:hypothetical protein
VLSFKQVGFAKFSTFYEKIFSLEGKSIGKENISVSCYSNLSCAVLCATSSCMYVQELRVNSMTTKLASAATC